MLTQFLSLVVLFRLIGQAGGSLVEVDLMGLQGSVGSS